MIKLPQFALSLRQPLPGEDNKPPVNLHHLLGGLVLGAAAATMISGGRIEIESFAGPYKFISAAAEEEPIRSAHASARDRLTPGIAAVCEASPLLGKTLVVLTPKMDDGFKVSALKYVPCSREELSKEIILLHQDDMQRIAKDALVSGPREVRAHIIHREPATPLYL